MCTFKTSTYIMKKKEERKCKLKMIHLEDIICLKLVFLIVIMNMWIHALRRGSLIMEYGEKFARLHQASVIKKMCQLEVVKIFFHLYISIAICARAKVCPW
jgi:hypothetical protein